MKTIILITACLFSTSALASSTAYLGALSAHFLKTSEYNYNENHNLIALETKGWFVGFFENSYYEDTWAIGKRFSKKYGNWEPGVLIGASYGYRNCMKGYDKIGEKRQTCPMIAPSLTYHGIKQKTGIKPTLMVLGNAVAVTIGVDFEAVHEWF